MISARGLTKVFGSHVAVDDLSFEVPPGRVTGFLGPNGAGKTTTLRMLLGLARPTAGVATVLGRPYAGLDHPARRVGVVLDGVVFHPRRTARNHLRWMAAAAGVREGRIREVLEAADLAAAGERRVGEFSLGMRQRLGLAAALLGIRSCWCWTSRPTGWTRPGSAGCGSSYAASPCRAGRCLCPATCSARWRKLADEVVVIQRGRLVTHTTVQALTAGPAGAMLVRTPDADRLTGVLNATGAEVRTRDSGGPAGTRHGTGAGWDAGRGGRRGAV